MRSLEMRHATHTAQSKEPARRVRVQVKITPSRGGLEGLGWLDLCSECSLVVGGECSHRYTTGGTAFLLTPSSEGQRRTCSICGAEHPREGLGLVGKQD